ncbi:serine hydrolase domain-containing protein [Neolewinella litorea]|uniref:Class A beta-lactamase-related serine hydrolase n=1 Tax=Neolewinella litorea TaxID=2562452 RepID=A0A4S4NKU3_9BACT|nr:serine hydrolase domain-containing protein [Neolewinella litorea]THH40402.1 class A beta-lactamase-related serine hydrolase [Neolewinella litorea]
MKYLLPLLILLTAPLLAQETGIESAAMAVERLLDQESGEDITTFINTYMGKVEDRPALVTQIRTLQQELAGLRDGILLDVEDVGAILTLIGNGVEKRLLVAYDFDAQRVTGLSVLPPEERLAFDLERPESAVEYMLDRGMAGLLYVESDGEVLIEQPFGMANESLGVANDTATIFAIGSRPIDFTVAAILLLDQRGELSLDDTLGVHLQGVPVAKRDITLRHLMTGRSGLPDFFHNESDWDADLQWIGRDEALRRLLDQPLIFPPGTGRAHSHGAYGMLAAIVELVSGQSYMNFLGENFFTPAGMTRTGEYGDRQGFSMQDFAVGGGPQFVGLPNIPPNWGPTSWLIKGSGGMYSTLGDLRRFYALVRGDRVFDEEHSRRFRGSSVEVDGSMRGFELFSVSEPPGGQVYLFLNRPGDQAERRKIFRGLEGLVN